MCGHFVWNPCGIRVEFHHPTHLCHTAANDQGPIRNRGIQCVRRTCRSKFSAFTGILQIGQRTCLPSFPSARHMRNCTSNRSFFISTQGPGLPPSAILALPALTSLRFGFELGLFSAPSPGRLVQPLERSKRFAFFDMKTGWCLNSFDIVRAVASTPKSLKN